MNTNQRFVAGGRRMLGLALPVMLLLGVAAGRATAEPAPRECPIAELAGQVESASGPPDQFVNVDGDTTHTRLLLPTCFLFREQLSVDPEVTAIIRTARGVTDLKADKRFRLDEPKPQEGSVRGFWGELKRIASGPTEKIAAYTVGRSGARCTSGSPAPPASRLSAPAALTDPDQQVGSDLPVLVAMWRPSVEVRLVDVQLLHSDGQVLASGATCRGNNLPLPLRAGQLRVGDTLALVITDIDQHSTIRYTLSVVEPSRLPQPPSPPGSDAPGQDWLAAAWRLQAAPRHTGLDSVARLAIASPSSFGAQRLLGTIAAEP